MTVKRLTRKRLTEDCADFLYAKEIAHKYGVSVPTIRAALRKFGLKRNKRHPALLKRAHMVRYYAGLKREYPGLTIREAQRLRRERRLKNDTV